MQGGVWAIGVVFAQKIHKFSAGSDDSIFGKVSIKFLSENPVTSSILPLYVGFAGGRTNNGISNSLHAFSKSFMNSEPPST